MEPLLSQLAYYKFKIDVPEIKDLCDLAMKIIKLKKRIEKQIKLGYIHAYDFRDFRTLTDEFIYRLLGTIRKFGIKEDQIGKLERDLKNELAMAEYEKRRLLDELREQPYNFPMVNEFIRKAERLIKTKFLNILPLLLRIKSKEMRREFVVDILQASGITPSPEVLKGLYKKEEESL